jgi:hypothetical protein
MNVSDFVVLMGGIVLWSYCLSILVDKRKRR